MLYFWLICSMTACFPPFLALHNHFLVEVLLRYYIYIAIVYLHFSYTAIHRGLLGSYRPLCDVDGYYTAMQCHEHHCWCARKDGTRLDVEAKSLAVCTCYRQADELMSTGTQMFIFFWHIHLQHKAHLVNA